MPVLFRLYFHDCTIYVRAQSEEKKLTEPTLSVSIVAWKRGGGLRDRWVLSAPRVYYVFIGSVNFVLFSFLLLFLSISLYCIDSPSSILLSLYLPFAYSIIKNVRAFGRRRKSAVVYRYAPGTQI